MNDLLDANTTHWQAAVDAITQAVNFDNGYIAENFILGLIRFGHDPDPNLAGTTIPSDSSGLVDGQKLDVGWYDPNAQIAADHARPMSLSKAATHSSSVPVLTTPMPPVSVSIRTRRRPPRDPRIQGADGRHGGA